MFEHLLMGSDRSYVDPKEIFSMNNSHQKEESSNEGYDVGTTSISRTIFDQGFGVDLNYNDFTGDQYSYYSYKIQASEVPVVLQDEEFRNGELKVAELSEDSQTVQSEDPERSKTKRTTEKGKRPPTTTKSKRKPKTTKRSKARLKAKAKAKGRKINKTNLIRSTKGCWICRLKHKKCNEAKPHCANCAGQHLQCDYSLERPEYVKSQQVRNEKLWQIKQIWLNRYKLQKFLQGDTAVDAEIFRDNPSYDEYVKSVLENRSSTSSARGN